MKSVILQGEVAHVLSPPTRGAWIEITMELTYSITSAVAPYEGGVD